MDKWRTRCSTGHVTVLQLLLPEAQDTSGAAASATAAKPMENQNKKSSKWSGSCSSYRGSEDATRSMIYLGTATDRNGSNLTTEPTLAARLRVSCKRWTLERSQRSADHRLTFQNNKNPYCTPSINYRIVT